jgi:hypothetical protein
MRRTALKVSIIIIALLSNLSLCFASADPIRFANMSEKKSPIMRTKISFGPVISFYKINKNHASDVKQKMAGVFCIKEEFRLNENHTMFLSVGAEYFVHGLSFFSYYFKPDSIQLYSDDFRYNYSMYVHEIGIPIQLRISFKRENNALVTPYMVLGYHLRNILFGSLKVQENGNDVVKKQEDLLFKNPIISKRNSPFASIALGIQKSKPNNTRRCVFMELAYRFGFSPYLLKDTFTPSSLYLNGSHLSVVVGFKF